MKKSLFLYLFILAALMNVFTYMYFSKEAAFEKDQHEKLTKKFTDSINAIHEKSGDANYFSLETNDKAQDYFTNTTYDKVIPLVTEKLMDLNNNPKGNPYTGQDQIGAQKFIFNKIKILNHRWIIADYSDGEYWGEALLKYFLNDDGTVSYETIQSVLYQK
ncbi:MAG TPA: hypothetical protein VK528_02060 [Flavobacterium sp.]|nr:hypothetical protein [Flavobacterium sp.]